MTSMSRRQNERAEKCLAEEELNQEIQAMEGQVRVSDFGLLSAFGLRVSGLEHFDRPSVARSLRPLQRAGWTMLHAFFGHLLQTLLNRVIKRCSYLYIESTSNEGKAKRFAGQFRQLHANPAEN